MKKPILILNQSGDKLYLLCNCYKFGYGTLIYFATDNPKNVYTQKLTSMYTTLSGLEQKSYYLYCKNDNEETIGHTSISLLTNNLNIFYGNVLNLLNLENDSESLNLIKNLKSENAIVEIYEQILLSNNETQKLKYENILLKLCELYNLRQESFNKDGFSFSYDQEISCCISEDNDIAVKFLPKIYDSKIKKFVLDQKSILYDRYKLEYLPNSVSLAKILIVDEFTTIREYLYYQPSKNVSTTKYEGRISMNKQIEDESFNLVGEIIEDINNIDYREQKTLVAMYNLISKDKIFQTPEVYFTKDMISIYINDYDFLKLFKKKLYVAALEIDAAYDKNFHAHRILISANNLNIDARDIFLNKEEDYIFFIIDEDGVILSDQVVVSYETDTNLEIVNSKYKKILSDKHIKKLSTVFTTKHPEEWEQIASLTEKWLTNNSEIDFYDFLLISLATSNKKLNDIKNCIYTIFLAKLTEINKFDPEYLNKQVYNNLSFMHILPEADAYIVQITRINKNSVVNEYFTAGATFTEINVKSDNFIAIRCINPLTYKSSSIAIYNVDGYHIYTNYLPGLEVELING